MDRELSGFYVDTFAAAKERRNGQTQQTAVQSGTKQRIGLQVSAGLRTFFFLGERRACQLCCQYVRLETLDARSRFATPTAVVYHEENTGTGRTHDARQLASYKMQCCVGRTYWLQNRPSRPPVLVRSSS